MVIDLASSTIADLVREAHSKLKSGYNMMMQFKTPGYKPGLLYADYADKRELLDAATTKIARKLSHHKNDIKFVREVGEALKMTGERRLVPVLGVNKNGEPVVLVILPL